MSCHKIIANVRRYFEMKQHTSKNILFLVLRDIKYERLLNECGEKEDGKTPLENAKIKAEAYYKAFGMPVFSCDSGLYFEGVAEEDQPGLFVRRVSGKELTDDEMIAHYGGLAEKYGGSLIARYFNAVHFILDENTSFSSMDISLASESFALVTEPHPKRVEGFPLDSLSKDIATGEYYYDLEAKDISTEGIVDGYYKFFSETLKHNF